VYRLPPAWGAEHLRFLRESTSGVRRFLAGFERRPVFRVIAACAVTACLAVRAADATFPAIPLPAWTAGLVV